MVLLTALDPRYVNPEFLCDTNWVAFTGAPSAGKTTILQELVKREYTCIPEVAREHVEQGLAKGLSLEDIRKDEAMFQKTLLSKKRRIEDSLTPENTVFLDRALPDSITYFRVSGLDPNKAAKECLTYRYKKVFFFERLTLSVDNAKTETDKDADFLQHWLEKDYGCLGYHIIPVPVMPVQARLELILSHL